MTVVSASCPSIGCVAGLVRTKRCGVVRVVALVLLLVVLVSADVAPDDADDGNRVFVDAYALGFRIQDGMLHAMVEDDELLNLEVPWSQPLQMLPHVFESLVEEPNVKRIMMQHHALDPLQLHQHVERDIAMLQRQERLTQEMPVDASKIDGVGLHQQHQLIQSEEAAAGMNEEDHHDHDFDPLCREVDGHVLCEHVSDAVLGQDEASVLFWRHDAYQVERAKAQLSGPRGGRGKPWLLESGPEMATILMAADAMPLVAGADGVDEDDDVPPTAELRAEVEAMFAHGLRGYLDHAFPYDELRPLSCTGVNSFGGLALTLVDTLDTLAVMGHRKAFANAVRWVGQRLSFDLDVNVSVFETNIRVLAALLSAHMLALEPELGLMPDYDGTLLTLARDLGNRLLPAFDTPTHLPYGTVNLRFGVPAGETTVTCTACAGTFALEFGLLSHLTGDPRYLVAAKRAARSLWRYRSPTGLWGTHIDIRSGHWVYSRTGHIGGSIDSYLEYLHKASVLFDDAEYGVMFEHAYATVNSRLRCPESGLYGEFPLSQPRGDMKRLYHSLASFWPGVMAARGDVVAANQTLQAVSRLWEHFSFLPEVVPFDSTVMETGLRYGSTSGGRDGYPLRPEYVESLYHTFRRTKDDTLLAHAHRFLVSLRATRGSCGHAAVENVLSRSYRLRDKMDSYFLSETCKYLYLLFVAGEGADHWLHEKYVGEHGADGDKWLFNTEAHVFPRHWRRYARPLDLGAFETEEAPHMVAAEPDAAAAAETTSALLPEKEKGIRVSVTTRNSKESATSVVVDANVLRHAMWLQTDGHAVAVQLSVPGDSPPLLKLPAVVHYWNVHAAPVDREQVEPLVVPFVAGAFSPVVPSLPQRVRHRIVAAQPEDACGIAVEGLTPPRFKDAIVVALRGGCAFVEKAAFVQALGAKALIVVNTDENDGLFKMAGDLPDGSASVDISIPSVLVHHLLGMPMWTSVSGAHDDEEWWATLIPNTDDAYEAAKLDPDHEAELLVLDGTE